MKIDLQVGRALRAIRLAKHFSQETVSESIGITPRYYQQIEAGEAHLRIAGLQKILDIHEVDLFSFFECLDGFQEEELDRNELDLFFSNVETIRLQKAG